MILRSMIKSLQRYNNPTQKVCQFILLYYFSKIWSCELNDTLFCSLERNIANAILNTSNDYKIKQQQQISWCL